MQARVVTGRKRDGRKWRVGKFHRSWLQALVLVLPLPCSDPKPGNHPAATT